ncbi:hypothetical protein ACFL6B_05245 [Thermodesulfobacteriota bacterium]
MHQSPCFGFNVKNDFWKELFIHLGDDFGVLVQIAGFDPYDWLGESEKFSDETEMLCKERRERIYTQPFSTR